MSNLLSKEDSPYLLQHKNNPVHWKPWGKDAFLKAKQEKKPIFISIGYSACHWCHVMEREVFENQVIADILNEYFICIKVDREERPDIDKYYQDVHMLLNQRAGGWPTSIFSTHENKPFFADTYIPPEDKYNKTGFRKLISIIKNKLEKNAQEIYNNADEIQKFLNPKQKAQKVMPIKKEIINTFIEQIQKSFEANFGGFSFSPKFPQTSILKTALEIYKLDRNKNILHIITHTLDNMTKGGLWDLVDYGFCRYSTDEKWLVPHFEKMTYDNALLAELYTLAFIETKNEKYFKIAEQIIEFMNKRMKSNELYFSASDADTKGIEGEYFVYEYTQLKNILEENSYTPTDIETILDALSVSPKGSFEGYNIIRINDTQANYPWFEKVRLILQALRSTREYPFIDSKILLSVNSMMINSLFIMGRIDAKYTIQAENTLNALLKYMLKNDNLYHTMIIGNNAKIDAFLEDYAYLSLALINGYHTNLKTEYLLYAQIHTNNALKKYFKGGKWTFSEGEFTTKADIYDASYPSSIAIMVEVLLLLGVLIDSKYTHFAYKTLEYYSFKLSKTPINYPRLCGGAIRWLNEPFIIKSQKDKLKNIDINQYNYPYIYKQITENEDFLLCNDTSCFANIKDEKNINDEVLKREKR